MINLVIGSDHRGFELKREVIAFLRDLTKSDRLDIEVNTFDVGTFSSDSVDYPDVVGELVLEMKRWKNPVGVLICGSGHGVNIAANRFPRIRSVTCRDNEDAKAARVHNNANVVAIGADFTYNEKACWIVETFLTTEFDGGERHQRRINKLG